MRLAAELPPAGSLRPLTTAAVIGLLWVSGLRLGEVCRLNLEDVDLETGVLHIQRSKNFKSRLIPLQVSAVKALSDYRRERDRRGHDQSGRAPFFINQRFRRLQLAGFEQTFRELTDQLGLRCPAGHRARLHDFRHSLATRCLAESYDDQRDPAARLSILATYLGHANVTETATYLHPPSALLNHAGGLFRAHIQKRSAIVGRSECHE
jgi:integrase